MVSATEEPQSEGDARKKNKPYFAENRGFFVFDMEERRARVGAGGGSVLVGTGGSVPPERPPERRDAELGAPCRSDKGHLEMESRGGAGRVATGSFYKHREWKLGATLGNSSSNNPPSLWSLVSLSPGFLRRN